MNGWRILVCMVACHLSVAAAFAQVNPMDRESSGERAFSLGLELGLDYIDNRDSSATNEASTFDIRVSPFVEGRRNSDLSRTEYGYKFTARNRSNPGDFEDADQYFHNAHLSVDYQLSPKTSIDVRDDLNYSDDPSVEEGGTTIRQDGSFFLNSAEALISHEIVSRHFLEGNAYSRIKNYDEDVVAGVSDEDTMSYGGTWWYQVSDRAAMLILATMQEFDYDDPDFERGFESSFYGLGIFATFGAEGRVSGRVGVKNLEFDDASLDAEEDIVTEFAVRNSEKANFRYRISAGHTIRDAELSPFASMEYDFVRLAFARDISSSVVGRISATYGMSDYSQLPDGVSALAEVGTEDETSITAGLEIRTSRRSRLLIRHVYQIVDSDVVVPVGDRNFDRNQTSVAWTGQL